MNPICQQCGTQNVIGAAFCDNCGSQLLPSDTPKYSNPAPAYIPPAPVAPVVPSAQVPLTCPTCHAPYQAGEIYCGNCGAPLGQPTPPNPAPDYQATYVPPPAAASPGTTICSQCGTPNAAGSAFCDNCGVSQIAPSPVPPSPGVYQPPSPGNYPPQPEGYGHQAAPYTPPGQSSHPAQPPYGAGGYPQPAITPRLVLQANNTIIPFPVGKSVLIIGREDVVSDHFPELDLGPHGAEQMGVSRSHARFTIQGNQVFIEDMQAVNYTFVNRQKLVPHTQRLLQNGDEIRLGKMILFFYMQ